MYTGLYFVSVAEDYAAIGRFVDEANYGRAAKQSKCHILQILS